MSHPMTRRSHVPIDRLSELADKMMKVLDAPENGDVQAMVFLHDRKSGTIGIHGYDGEEADIDAMADLIVHLKAVFAMHGKSLDVMSLDDDGITRA
jgi:hypothetical protein